MEAGKATEDWLDEPSTSISEQARTVETRAEVEAKATKKVKRGPKAPTGSDILDLQSEPIIPPIRMEAEAEGDLAHESAD